MLKNEVALRNGQGAQAQVETELISLWDVMKSCIERGCRTEGIYLVDSG